MSSQSPSTGDAPGLIERWREHDRWRKLGRHAWRHFREDRHLEEAASLGYTTLLALIPLLVVAFSIISALPAYRDWAGDAREFLFRNFVPTAGEQIEQYVETFMESATALTASGTAFLVASALLLMVRIETALNRTWRVTSPRSMGNRITMYWTVLTLGPLAIGATTALSAVPLLSDLGGGFSTSPFLRGSAIFLFTWLAFTLLFVIVPNCRVRWTHAAVGALASAILFTLVKQGFVVFVSRASFNAIYGALATIPIFLMWLYLVWAVILFGASLAASLTTWRDRPIASAWPNAWRLLLAFRVMGHLRDAQVEGEGVAMERLLELEAEATDEQLHRILRTLHEAGMVVRDENDAWRLARDLGAVTVADLYRSDEYHLPIGEPADLPELTAHDRMLIGLLEDASGGSALQRPLASLFHQPTRLHEVSRP